MQQFSVDGPADSCNSCCCENASVRAGETDLWRIDYSAWAIPIGGKGLSTETTFQIEQVVRAARPDPEALNQNFSTPINVPTAETSLATVYGDDTSDLSFAVVPMFPPRHGTLDLAEDGTFTYTPAQGWRGVDKFYYSVTRADGKPSIAEVLIAVGGVPVGVYDDPIEIPDNRVNVNRKLSWLEFAMVVSPAAVVGDVFRLTIRQATLDCDCNPFYHLSCYDISVDRC